MIETSTLSYKVIRYMLQYEVYMYRNTNQH